MTFWWVRSWRCTVLGYHFGANNVGVDSNVTCLFCISLLVSCVVALVAQLIKDHLWRDRIQIKLVVVCRVFGRFQKPIEVTWN